jgi:hypothetical protein
MLSNSIKDNAKRVFIPASRMYATSSLTPAARSVFVTTEEGVEIDVWAFDASTVENVAFVVENLGNYVGFELLWTSTSGSAGNVVWNVQGNSINVSRTTDVAATTSGSVTSAHAGVAQYLNSCKFAATRMGNGIAPPATELGPVSVWQITRFAANGADTLSGDAFVLGVFATFYG